MTASGLRGNRAARRGVRAAGTRLAPYPADAALGEYLLLALRLDRLGPGCRGRRGRAPSCACTWRPSRRAVGVRPGPPLRPAAGRSWRRAGLDPSAAGVPRRAAARRGVHRPPARPASRCRSSRRSASASTSAVAPGDAGRLPRTQHRSWLSCCRDRDQLAQPAGRLPPRRRCRRTGWRPRPDDAVRRCCAAGACAGYRCRRGRRWRSGSSTDAPWSGAAPVPRRVPVPGHGERRAPGRAGRSWPSCVAHEAYPGHHTERCRKEPALVARGARRAQGADRELAAEPDRRGRGRAGAGAVLGPGWGSLVAAALAELGLGFDGELAERVDAATAAAGPGPAGRRAAAARPRAPAETACSTTCGAGCWWTSGAPGRCCASCGTRCGGPTRRPTSRAGAAAQLVGPRAGAGPAAPAAGRAVDAVRASAPS